MIRLEDVTLMVGGREIVTAASWHIRPGDKVGLTGRSGSGKTSILRAIHEDQHIESGRIVRRPRLAIGYLPQEAVAGSSLSVWDESRSRMQTQIALEARVQSAQLAVEAETPGAVEELDLAMEAFRMAGGWSAEERIGTVLHGLGFSKSDWERPCDQFSGGWQMRVALARVLLSSPNLMLLDEPTNHLDLQARSWLARHLVSWPGAVVVVSHDRYLLDAVSSRIAELRSTRLHLFTGNWSAWLAERDLRHAQAQAAFESQQREIERLSGFVNRFRAKATKAAQARSRQKELDRMVVVQAPETERTPRLRLPPAPPSSDVMVTLIRASAGWPGEPPILDQVELVVNRGARLALIGPNGCGKTTLLRSIDGSLALKGGLRHVGANVNIGTYSQGSASELPEDQNPVEYLMAQVWRLEPERARSVLGALGISGEAALRNIGSLSGGERARVALGRLALGDANLLLLDEPTNHLDIATVAVLARALERYEGAIVLVTHDRWFVETLATHVGLLRGGRLEIREGVRPDDFEPEEDTAGRTGAGQGRGAEDFATQKRRARERERLERRSREIQSLIEANEKRILTLDQDMLGAAERADYRAAGELHKERELAQVEIDTLFQEWERVDAELRASGD